jgi:hypothetical protein
MFAQPDLEKPYQDACTQAEREEERIEQMADWIDSEEADCTPRLATISKLFAL